MDSRGYSTFLSLKSVEISMEFREYSTSQKIVQGKTTNFQHISKIDFTINYENKKISLNIEFSTQNPIEIHNMNFSTISVFISKFF